jgi:hypothetical protein
MARERVRGRFAGVVWEDVALCACTLAVGAVAWRVGASPAPVPPAPVPMPGSPMTMMDAAMLAVPVWVAASCMCAGVVVDRLSRNGAGVDRSAFAVALAAVCCVPFALAPEVPDDAARIMHLITRTQALVAACAFVDFVLAAMLLGDVCVAFCA